MKLTNEWQPYDGNYQKQLQDIKLENGDIVEYCWPNANIWNVMREKGNEKYYNERIEHNMAKFVRLSNPLN